MELSGALREDSEFASGQSRMRRLRTGTNIPGSQTVNQSLRLSQGSNDLDADSGLGLRGIRIKLADPTERRNELPQDWS